MEYIVLFIRLYKHTGMDHVKFIELLYIIFIADDSYTDTFLSSYCMFVWVVLNLQSPDSTDIYNMGWTFFVFHEKTWLCVCANSLFLLSVIVMGLTEECKSTELTYQWKMYQKCTWGNY
jgi:hypothetical protein